MTGPSLPAFLLLAIFAGFVSAQHTRVNVPIGPDDTDVTLHLFLFDSHRTEVRIISRHGAERQDYANLNAAMRAHQCVAGCNGGPADGNGNPLGLVIADGKQIGKASSGVAATEGVFYVDGSQPRIERAVKFFEDGAINPSYLLQAGPLLIEDGRLAPEIDQRQVARRTFVLTDGDRQWAIGYAPATTLHKLAHALADSEVFNLFSVQAALALGGSSASAIWMNRKHGPLYLKELRSGPNFVGLTNR